MPLKPRSKTSGPATGLWLNIPEEVLARLAVAENLPALDEDVMAGTGLVIEEAQREIAQALLETGRPLRHLHALQLAIDTLAVHRGYREGLRSASAIVNGAARDEPDS